jgi:hypothetical protein
MASADQVCKTTCLRASRLRRQPSRCNRWASGGIDGYRPKAAVRAEAIRASTAGRWGHDIVS